MSWRFRKSFKVIPGVRLNVTRRGLSATLGAAPFSINVGPRGVYRNLSIPGTGLLSRERIDQPRPLLSVGGQPPASRTPPPPPLPVELPRAGEIHSSSTEMLTSETLVHMRDLLKQTHDERDALTKELEVANTELAGSKNKYERWETSLFAKRLFTKSFAARREAYETADAKQRELQEQLRQTTVATEIAMDREQAEPYFRMRDDFAALCECAQIWNVMTQEMIDRVKMRSAASSSVTRQNVSFALSGCDLIAWDQNVPHLPNLTGGDMFVFPGFVLYRASKQAFALMEFKEVRLRYVLTEFTEDGRIPPDSKIVHQTWAKVNKDGSPDRRFNGNYQIPVVHYGALQFSSADGLDVRYLCSNPALADRFVRGWKALQLSFGGVDSNADLARDSLRNALDHCTETTKAFFGESVGPTKMTRSGDDFNAFMKTVTDLIHAAKVYELDSATPRSYKSKLTRAADDFEVSRAKFEEAATTGTIDQPVFDAYSSAFLTFVNVIVSVLTHRPRTATT